MPRSIFTTALMAAFVCVLCLGLAPHAVADRTAEELTDEEKDGFVPIFNGKDLDGWYAVGGKSRYEVKDGAIVGSVGPGGNAFLRTEKTFADFEFRCEFKWDVPGNSGIQYRSQQKEDKQGKPTGRVYGYQYELDHRDRAWSGGLYEEGRRGWLQNVAGDDNAHKRAAIKLSDWNDIVIRCEGNRIQTWLNGVQITDYTDKDEQKALTSGFFALQVHSGGKGVMRWRNIRVKELRAESK